MEMIVFHAELAVMLQEEGQHLVSIVVCGHQRVCPELGLLLTKGRSAQMAGKRLQKYGHTKLQGVADHDSLHGAQDK